MASVSAILDQISFSGTNWAKVEISAPGGFLVHEPQHSMVYLVVQQEAIFERQDEEPVTLYPGEAAIYLSGEHHCIKCEPGADPTTLTYFASDHEPDSVPVIRLGGRGDTTRVLAARLSLSVSPFSPMLALAPRTLYLRRHLGEGRSQINPEHIREITARAAERGGAALLTRVANMLLLRAIHEHVVHAGDLSLFPRTAGVARALQLIACHPGNTWTVARLASEAGMSRSAFAADFQATTGKGPMHYVAERRLAAAAELLEKSNTRVLDIATKLGYQSDAAFTRAFKRQFQLSPRGYRTASRNPELRSRSADLLAISAER